MTRRGFGVWIRHDGYEASFEPDKIYVVLAGEDAERHGAFEAIDKGGEEYLFLRRSLRRDRAIAALREAIASEGVNISGVRPMAHDPIATS